MDFFSPYKTPFCPSLRRENVTRHIYANHKPILATMVVWFFSCLCTQISEGKLFFFLGRLPLVATGFVSFPSSGHHFRESAPSQSMPPWPTSIQASQHTVQQWRVKPMKVLEQTWYTVFCQISTLGAFEIRNESFLLFTSILHLFS